MQITVPDAPLKDSGLSERELRIELACRLFDIGKLQLWPAAQLAGLTRVEMEDALQTRRIPIHRVDQKYWQQEFESLQDLPSPPSDPRAKE